MDQIIIYQNDEGKAAVIVPSPNTPLSINEIALKDVPAGKPYKIIDKSILPEDRTFREAWEADISTPDGYGIGQEAWFLSKEEML